MEVIEIFNPSRSSHRRFTRNDRRLARSGGTIHLVIIAIVGILLVGSAVGYFAFGSGESGSGEQPITALVEKDDFVSMVVDQGKLESSENVEIKCQVESRGGSLTVLEVVQEGTRVKGGDFLVRLDSSAFEKELQQQKLAVSAAKTSVIQAQASFDTAEVAKTEYEEGTYIELRQGILNDIYTAEQQLEQAQAVVLYSQKLQKKGMIPTQQMKSDLVAVEQAKNSLSLARRKLKVLDEYTKKKEMIRLQGDIEAAKVQLENQKEDLEEEQSEYEEIEQQIANCTINVPEGREGQVVYNKEFSRGGNQEWVLEEGASVRERQVLIRLPNPEKMQVKAAINEQSISTVEAGMPVGITIDALPGVKLKGVVTGVSQYAESSGWMSSNIPKFPVYIQIIDPPSTLKADMTATISIQTEMQKDVIQVPIQCVYTAGENSFCLVKGGDKNVSWDTRKVKLGSSNSKSAWIVEGLEEGEEVAMNPGAYRELLDLPEDLTDDRIEISEEERKQVEADMKKGSSSGVEADGMSRGGGGRGGNGRGGAGGGGGFSVDSIVDRSMERYDANSDGIIDKDEMAEVDERFRGRISDADTDGDGGISRDELKKSMEAMMKQMQQGGGGFGGGGRGGGGQGGQGGRGGRGGGAGGGA